MVATRSSGTAGIVVLGTEQQAAWGRRELPPVEQLPGGLWSVPVPIPDNPLRYTLSYLILGDSGLVIVDPGWDDDDSWVALQAGISTAGAALSDVVGVIATHIHPDHHGLSLRLREQTGAWVAMHPAERDNLPQRIDAAPEVRRQRMAEMLRIGGAPEEDVAALLGAVAQAGDEPLMAEPDVLLEDGDYAPLPGRRLRTLWTPGHTPGHICLLDEDATVLLTGDHVLPRISPSIGLHPASDSPPLAQFLGSLAKVGSYDDYDALPAHEYRFRGLGARTQALIEHHEVRCRELVSVVAGLDNPTIWAVAKALTWSRGWAEIGPMRFAALAETAAHVRHLVDRGELAWSAPERSAVRVRLAGTSEPWPSA